MTSPSTCRTSSVTLHEGTGRQRRLPKVHVSVRPRFRQVHARPAKDSVSFERLQGISPTGPGPTGTGVEADTWLQIWGRNVWLCVSRFPSSRRLGKGGMSDHCLSERGHKLGGLLSRWHSAYNLYRVCLLVRNRLFGPCAHVATQPCFVPGFLLVFWGARVARTECQLWTDIDRIPRMARESSAALPAIDSIRPKSDPSRAQLSVSPGMQGQPFPEGRIFCV